MSELDFYLLVALSCTICGFFIGMGQVMVMEDQKLYDPPPTPGVKVVFSLVSLVGIGYFTAWLWVSHQPLFKLIPVLLLAYFACVFGAGLTRARITPWIPAAGVVVMPTMFHGARYLGLAG